MKNKKLNELSELILKIEIQIETLSDMNNLSKKQEDKIDAVTRFLKNILFDLKNIQNGCF